MEKKRERAENRCHKYYYLNEHDVRSVFRGDSEVRARPRVTVCLRPSLPSHWRGKCRIIFGNAFHRISFSFFSYQRLLSPFFHIIFHFFLPPPPSLLLFSASTYPPFRLLLFLHHFFLISVS